MCYSGNLLKITLKNCRYIGKTYSLFLFYILSKFNSFDQVVFIFTFLNDRFLAVYHESVLLLNGVIKRVALAIGQAPYFL